MRALYNAWSLLIGLLRELSDESAYVRYLSREGAVHSPGEWRKFHNRRLSAKYARAKCC